MNFLRTLVLLLLPLILLALPARAQNTSSLWSSRVLVPGERAMLMVLIDGDRPELTDLPKVDGLSVQLDSAGSLIYSGRQIYVITLLVTAERTGKFQLPPVQLIAATGSRLEVPSVPLSVVPVSNIRWIPFPAPDEKVSYGVLWALPQDDPYVNQPASAWLKIYLPTNFTHMQIPNVETRGVAAQRFENPLFRFFGDLRIAGSARIDGKELSVGSFTSELTPIAPGKVTVGPGQIVAYYTSQQSDPRLGMIRMLSSQMALSIPEASFTARPLPPGAPANFRNALGDFTLAATSSASELSLNEPVSLTLTINANGPGNLNLIDCPSIDPDSPDASAWKLYPANKLEPTRNGEVRFQVLLRPIAKTSTIPAFVLPFFNPKTGTYSTASTQPIPLPWKGSETLTAESRPATLPPPAGKVPVAEMTDIFGPVAATALIPVPLDPWILAAFFTPAIILIILAILMALRSRRHKNAPRRVLLDSLAGISPKLPDNDFLRHLSAFIETRIPDASRTPEIRKIIALRDASAFTPPDSSPSHLSQASKQAMLGQVKSAIRKLPPASIPPSAAVSILAVLALLSCCNLAPAAPAPQPLPPQTPASTPGALLDEEAKRKLARPPQTPASTPATLPPPTSESPVELYAKGNFPQALANAQAELANPSLDSARKAELLFLSGNACYRQGLTGPAMFYWYKTLAIAPDFSQAQRNIAFIQRKDGISSPIPPTATPWFMFLSANFWNILAAASLAILLLALASRLFPRARSWSASFWLVASLSLLAAATAITAIALRFNANPLLTPSLHRVSISLGLNGETSVVLENSALHHDASSLSPPLVSVPAGSTVTILANRTAWSYVELPNLTRGWIPSSTLSSPLTSPESGLNP